MAEVLVVDDDQTVREVVVSYLRAGGHEVTAVGNGEAALSAMQRRRADLVVLDLMLPGVGGLEVCRRLRESTDVPIIMLTALGSESDRLVGLRLGADDYVTKPFSPRELALRVDSVLRRVQMGNMRGAARERRHARRRPRRARRDTGRATPAADGARVRPAALPLSHAGEVWTREDLLREVWGWSFGDQSTVTVHVRRLREKVEADPTRPTRLLTVWGVGYRWEPS